MPRYGINKVREGRGGDRREGRDERGRDAAVGNFRIFEFFRSIDRENLIFIYEGSSFEIILCLLSNEILNFELSSFFHILF